ncbi:hypothetical protein BJF81_12340 [Ornithinimicrobium sp. CNJ-824]|nr:hypothetical protein BJF81_12340 [Ornithinimicrobium sp. CNJ-824]
MASSSVRCSMTASADFRMDRRARCRKEASSSSSVGRRSSSTVWWPCWRSRNSSRPGTSATSSDRARGPSAGTGGSRMTAKAPTVRRSSHTARTCSGSVTRGPMGAYHSSPNGGTFLTR